MKLSVYAHHEVGVSYRNAFHWFTSGEILGRQIDTGTILLTEPIRAPQTAECPVKVGISTRVSAAENKDKLDGQAIRLRDYCAAKDYPVTWVVKEIGSGVNDTRPKLLQLLTDPRINRIFVEHKDRLTSLTDKRNRKVNHYLHWASRYIVDWMVSERPGTLIIGHNKGWKQNGKIGRINNQNFVAIPHSRFIHMLTYKALLAGIRVIVQEEGYTSKCSFLDMEPIAKQTEYLGQRVKRGEFISAQGIHIHADVNGSYNILRKALPSAFCRGIQGVVVRPLRVQPVQKLVKWHCL
jgi:IS605 OrfB family transposase